MTRPLRIEFSRAYYHVMNRGLAYQAIYQDEKDRKLFLELLGEAHARWNLQIYAFCLMKNHYHLCVQTPTVFLSRIMRHINGVYTQKYNIRHKRDGPIFRGRYKAILVEKEQYLLTVFRYIHQNPFRSEDIEQPEMYRWSSSQYYLTDREKPHWLDTEMVLDYFGGKKEKLLNFIMEKEPSDIHKGKPYQPEYQGPLLGSEEFKEKIRTESALRINDPEIPEKRYLAISIKKCVRSVSAAYGIDEERIKMGRRGASNEARHVTMYICREVGGYRHREIAEALKAGSYSTVSSACALLKKRMKSEESLRRKVKAIYDEMIGHKRVSSDLTPRPVDIFS